MSTNADYLAERSGPAWMPNMRRWTDAFMLGGPRAIVAEREPIYDQLVGEIYARKYAEARAMVLSQVLPRQLGSRYRVMLPANNEIGDPSTVVITNSRYAPGDPNQMWKAPTSHRRLHWYNLVRKFKSRKG